MPIPDFIIMLDKDITALNEIINLQIPLIGVVDTDMDQEKYVYKFFGNNDSIENLEFFFQFLKEAAVEGRLKEQQLFFYYLISNIKKKIHGKKY
jgi:ribosomal protein S2